MARQSTAMQFGLSTHLFHGFRLEQRHLAQVRDHGFTLLEVFATRTHVDYHDARQTDAIRSWADGLGLTIWSVHAPICDGFRDGLWGRAYSNASPNAPSRDEAVRETLAAVSAAARLGARTIVVHLGIPEGQPIPARDNDAVSVRRSLEPIARACEDAGVQLSLEVIPNALSSAAAVLEWLESDLDLGSAGACLDIGHAHLAGGVPQAAELLSGYLVTTHVHDNRGRADDHLLPFEGTVDWTATMLALCKVGYTGPLVFEVPDQGDAEAALAGLVRARDRIQAILDDLTTPFPFEDDV